MARKIREYRHQNAIVAAANGVMERIDPRRGRVYCNLAPLGTATGRFSCSSPNLQGIPRELRQVFIADEGFVLLEADFSQMELRVLAHFTEDPLLTEAFTTTDVDIHRRTASLIFGVSEDAITSRQREVGKQTNFAIIYGETEFGLSRELGTPREEAEEFIERYLDGYAGVRRWIESVHEQAIREGSVNTLYGRRRQLAEIHDDDQFKRQRALRQAVNTVIQGTAADINKLAIIRLRRALPSFCRLLLTVHDSVLLEVPRDAVDLVSRIVREKMEASPLQFTVPLSVGIKAERRWG